MSLLDETANFKYTEIPVITHLTVAEVQPALHLAFDRTDDLLPDPLPALPLHLPVQTPPEDRHCLGQGRGQEGARSE